MEKFNFEEIRDKQRILVIGNEGTEEIIKISSHILDSINKPYDVIYANGQSRLTDAPVVLIQGTDNFNTSASEAEFLQYRHHIVVIHHIIDENLPKEYTSLEDYVAQYETLAKRTPKGGSLLYNKEDDVVTVIGSQDYEDVILKEYESMPMESTEEGFRLDNGITVKTNNENFPIHCGATKALLERLRVTEQEFEKGLSSYKD